MDKRVNKMDKETLEQYLAFRKRSFAVKSKKGKGSYDRKQAKRELLNYQKEKFGQEQLLSLKYFLL